MEYSSSTSSARSRPHDEEADDEARSERWLLSYADLVTTLMVFFLALYILQLSRTKEAELKARANAVVAAALPAPSPAPRAGREQMKTLLAPLVARQEIVVSDTPQGVEIAINAKVLFDSAEASIRHESFDELGRVAQILKRAAPTSIVVVGHTDDTPIATAKYASNWELSAARAGAVVRFFVEHGIESRRLAAMGRADNDLVVLGNDAAARAANRRVTILAQF
ncbi:OmpA/MotB family protein [Paraburkholderia phosphatilytica]|uniref:OmpA/MotB family protein n=1 Tax=Paraburkholderia phosphatilytica TaxID=2282883 RepID=UPI000E4897B1|nr:OmpA family protein [Paraburkholderia phosphatilytica]